MKYLSQNGPFSPALRSLETEIVQFYQVTRLTYELVGLRNAVRSAVIITLAAWGNKESMGAH